MSQDQDMRQIPAPMPNPLPPPVAERYAFYVKFIFLYNFEIFISGEPFYG